MTDLFSTPKPKRTQKEQVYDFIKSNGRVPTHELNAFGLRESINSVQSRARELKAESLIWRMSNRIKLCTQWKDSKEEVWSTYEVDREES
jgi:hypothetical protein